ncbi:hypothetical protein NJD71_12850 [Psychrobacter sp. PP-21]|uniref:hypothetical protein n=1 Tax=Psychrobacter sp. PP-21 TaxID=2957503 RepID=UPI0029AE1FDB|nr:hypothetical protein [Psychrobacter sp. PP-21]MDX2375005.1 hypothetical protein [Psychrobacter sp. PP-21]
MKIIKLMTPLLVSSFLIAPSFATGFQMPFTWGDYGDRSASVMYMSGSSEDSKILIANITHSASGHQGLYFSDHYVDTSDVCSFKTTVPSRYTMVFNGQAVKMLRWCKKFTDVDQYYFELTPATERGDNYVIRLFKKATLPIKIQYDNETLNFPVIGFTKAWNSAGGDAI